MARIGRGSSFIPHMPLSELERLHRKEEDKKAKVRLLCAVKRKRGSTVIDISKAVKLPKSTVSDHLRRLEFKGLEKRYDIKNKGAEPRLTMQQEKELIRILSKKNAAGNLWNTWVIKILIKEKFDKEFTLHGIRKLLKRLGFNPEGKRPYRWVK